MNYNDITWRYFCSDERVGSLTGPEVTRGTAGHRAQGTWVQFDLEWRRAAGAGAVAAGAGDLRVSDGRFLVFGCPHTIAVAAWLVEQAVAEGSAGTGLPEAVPLIARRFCVPIEKLGRLLLVEDAWNAACREASRSKPLNRPGMSLK
jgi:hypothetical protein